MAEPATVGEPEPGDHACLTLSLAGAAAAHGRAVAAVTYHHDAVLRIYRQHLPPGVRIAGEPDYRGPEPLTRALSGALTVVCQTVVGKVLRALGADRIAALKLVIRDVG